MHKLFEHLGSKVEKFDADALRLIRFQHDMWLMQSDNLT